MDKRLINELKVAQKSGGDPNQHIDNLLAGASEEEEEDEVKKRVESFNKLAPRLRNTIGYIFRHPESIEEIESKELDDLREKLDELKTLIEQSQPTPAPSASAQTAS